MNIFNITPESNDRNIILNISVQLEDAISEILSNALGISENAINTNSFGIKSCSLSLNHKVNLLLDMSALNDVEKKYFTKFMEIRNKFAHTKAVNTFHEYFCNERSNFKFLENQFNIGISNYEFSEPNSVIIMHKLFDKIFEITNRLYDDIIKNSGKIGVRNVKIKFYDTFFEKIKDSQYLPSIDERAAQIISRIIEDCNHELLDLIIDVDESGFEKYKGHRLL